MTAHVYILASKRNGVLYVGVTADLVRRIYVHKSCFERGFTWKYNVHRLVYAEPHAMIAQAIQREKSIKRWPRAWKINLIESVNPEWADLYERIL